MNRLQALIWDVDGTLAETERDGHRVAFNAAFEQLGMPWRWSEARYGELLAVAGGRERLLHDLQSQPQAPQDDAGRAELAGCLHRLKNRLYADIIAGGRIQLRAGVAALMDDCDAAGLPMAIATTSSRSSVHALLQSTLGPGGPGRFACVLCAEDAPDKKPDPQVYELALQRLGLPAHTVLALEDSPAGLGACLAARVPVVVTRSSYFSRFAAEGAVASGPGLHQREGWRVASAAAPGAAVERGPGEARVDLELLRHWFEAGQQAS